VWTHSTFEKKIHKMDGRLFQSSDEGKTDKLSQL
jgi:hypothetical protein